jgi:hypothetical protein
MAGPAPTSRGPDVPVDLSAHVREIAKDPVRVAKGANR